MKNKAIALGLTGLALASAPLASAQLVTTEATGAITEAITSGTVVIAAGFAIGALFLVARVIRRGMSSAR